MEIDFLLQLCAKYQGWYCLTTPFLLPFRQTNDIKLILNLVDIKDDACVSHNFWLHLIVHYYTMMRTGLGWCSFFRTDILGLFWDIRGEQHEQTLKNTHLPTTLIVIFSYKSWRLMKCRRTTTWQVLKILLFFLR